MFQWLAKLFSGRTAAQAARDNPVLRKTVRQSSLIYEGIPLREHIDREQKDALARTMYLDINAICNAVDPVAGCRDKLAAAMLRFALLQVLVIPPPPAADSSGLRGQPGISGELKEHLVALVGKSDELRSELHGVLDPNSFDAVWAVVIRCYWIAYWALETVNVARIELGDHTDKRDWYRAFMHATCASAEHRYRVSLDLPPATDNAVSNTASTAYSLFTDIVLAGASDPDQEWRDYHRGSDVPMPNFGSGA